MKLISIALAGAIIALASETTRAAGCENPYLLEDRAAVVQPCTDVIDRAGADRQDRAKAFEYRARAYRLLNRIDEAWRDLESGLDLAPDEAGLILLRGSLSYAKREMEGSLADALRALELAPADPRSLDLLIAIALYFGGMNNAKELIDYAATIDAGSVSILIQKAQYHSMRLEYMEAVRALDAVIASDRVRERNANRFNWHGRLIAADIGLELKRADAFRAHGDHGRAAEAVENAVRARRDEITLSERAYDKLSRPVRFGESRLVDALADAEAAHEINPNYARGESVRGVILHYIKRPNDALVALDHAIEIDPSHDYLWQRGRVLRDLGRPDDAARDFEASIVREPITLEGVVSKLRGLGLYQDAEIPDGLTPTLVDGLKACALDPRCW